MSLARIPSISEPNGVSRSNGKRPDGMTVYSFKNGRIMVWDCTISDTIAFSHIQISSAFRGKVAESAETAKLTKYCRLRFYQLEFKLLVLGSKWTEIDKKNAKKIAHETGESRSTSFLLER